MPWFRLYNEPCCPLFSEDNDKEIQNCFAVPRTNRNRSVTGELFQQWLNGAADTSPTANLNPSALSLKNTGNRFAHHHNFLSKIYLSQRNNFTYGNVTDFGRPESFVRLFLKL